MYALCMQDTLVKYIKSSICFWRSVTRSEIHIMQDNGSKHSVAFSWYDVSFRHVVTACVCTRGADKSLARPGRKQATATEDFEFHISYL
jgi:hypothetical protein